MFKPTICQIELKLGAHRNCVQIFRVNIVLTSSGDHLGLRIIVSYFSLKLLQNMLTFTVSYKLQNGLYGMRKDGSDLQPRKPTKREMALSLRESG